MRSISKSLLPLADVAGAVMPRLARAAAVTLVVVLPLVVSPWGEDGYNQVKVLTVLVLAAISVLGWMGARLTTGSPRWKFTAPELAVWGFLFLVLLSVVTSVDATLSVFGAPGRYEGLFAFSAYTALFFVGVHFFGSQSGFRSLAAAAGVAAMATIGYGVLQLFSPPLFAGEAFVRTWYAGLGLPRVPSTLGSPVVFGGYLSTMTWLLLALGLASGGRSRYIWSAAACLAVPALALTLTRAAWLAACAGMVAFVLSVGRATWRGHGRIVAAIVVALVVSGTLLVTAVGTPAQIASRVAASVERGSGSLAQRLYIWDGTLDLIRKRPWLGWGLETLGKVFPYDQDTMVRYFGLRPTIVDKAHNDVLQMAVSIGIPGAMAYVAVWLLVLVTAARLWKREIGSGRVLAAGWLAAMIAYLIQVQFSFSTVALAPIVWLLAGSAAGWESGKA